MVWHALCDTARDCLDRHSRVKAGIHMFIGLFLKGVLDDLDSRLRGNDGLFGPDQ